MRVSLKTEAIFLTESTYCSCTCLQYYILLDGIYLQGLVQKKECSLFVALLRCEPNASHPVRLRKVLRVPKRRPQQYYKLSERERGKAGERKGLFRTPRAAPRERTLGFFLKGRKKGTFSLERKEEREQLGQEVSKVHSSVVLYIVKLNMLILLPT